MLQITTAKGIQCACTEAKTSRFFSFSQVSGPQNNNVWLNRQPQFQKDDIAASMFAVEF